MSRIELAKDDGSGDPPKPGPVPKEALEFWSHADKNGPTLRVDLGPCWVWLRHKKANGYGQTSAPGTRYAHRRAWELANGPIPIGLWVLHRCDNPPCVNPQHLFLGNRADNVRDMVSKGRHGFHRHPESAANGDRNGARIHPERLSRGDAHWSRTSPEKRATGHRHGSNTKPETRVRGSKNGMAKLDEAAVRAIRADTRGLVAIAAEYGVSFSTVGRIKQRKSWGHIE